MSIAITAPQNFDFQDLVCIELALRFGQNSDLAMHVEPKDGEDAQIDLPLEGSGKRIIEVQVKGSEGAVTLRTLTACLAHFPPRQSARCLLERLIADPKSLALLVTSGRCDDTASAFVAKPSWTGAPLSAGQIKQDIADGLLLSLSRVSEGDSELQKQRKMHCEYIASTLRASELRKVLERVVVLERHTPEFVEAECQRRLKRVHRISDDRLSDTLNQLRDAVKRAKSKGTDAFPAIQEVLRSATPDSVLPPNYIERGDEVDILSEFARRRVMLLSGAPRCGKSDLARWLGAQFETQGYDVQIGADVDIADRFLREPTKTTRLFILDDPLGGAHAEPDAGRIYERLKRLIEQLPSQRRLIVAQSKELILEVTRRASIADCVTGGLTWKDLSESAPDFLSRLWRVVAEKAGVDTSLRERLADALLQGAVQLEPGSLLHLASSKEKLPIDASIEDAVRVAREPAQLLGISLSEELHAEEVLSSLAIATTPDNSVTSQELAFVLKSDSAVLPGKADHLSGGIQFGGDVEPEVRPKYLDQPALDPTAETILERLERRGIINYATATSFTHPFYRAAAEHVLENPSNRLVARLLKMIEAALFCLASETSRATARNLDWIFKSFSNRRTAQNDLLKLGISGMQSIFPATRDICFSFLLRRFDELPRDLQEELPNWARSLSSIELDDLIWDNGEARLPTGIRAASYSWLQSHQIQETDVADELASLNDDISRDLAPESAAKALSFFAFHQTAMSINAVGRLLSYNEAAIRAEAARIWLATGRSSDEAILARIFHDASPNVARQALVGVCASWQSITSERREVMLRGLKIIATLPSAAVVLFDNLLVFNRVEIFGYKPPWPIFKELMPLVMQALPAGTIFTDGRLYSVVSDAQDFLDLDSMLAVCAGWIDWLERELANDNLPSDYALGVLDILISATATQPQARQSLFDRLIGLKGTGASMSLLRDCIDEWENLTDYEQTRVLNRLHEDRIDRSWLRAIAITRRVVPAAIQNELLGAADALTSVAPNDVIETMPKDLLAAAVCVYCGNPEPLWYIGTHHSKSVLWPAIVKELALRPDHPQFTIALLDAVFLNDDETVAHVVSLADPSHLDLLFQTLLQQRATRTGNYLTRSWETLLRRAPTAATEERWWKSLAKFAPGMIEDLRELLRWLEADDLRAKMLDILASDYAAEALVYALLELPNPENVTDSILEPLSALLDQQPMRLFGTYDSIRRPLKLMGPAANELINKVDQLRAHAFTIRQQIREELTVRESPPSNWITP